MKLEHLTVVLAVLATLAFAGGCDKDAEAETTETPAADTPPEETAEAPEAEETAQPAEQAEPAAEAEGESGGGSVCERAQSCCEAYVNAVAGDTPSVSVESTCGAVQNAQGPAADATCQAAIDGWRTSLQAAQRDVPSACQGEGG